MKETKLGSLSFSSPLLLAPMSSICNYPFRYLMQMLGCGGTVSELVSCHGINYQNDKTLKMLYINKNEKNVGIQLFGEDGASMAKAAKVAQEFGPGFIDLNLGCPVNKVVKKGGGSALLRDPSILGKFFADIKKELNIPLTIKIRTGWDEENINASEVINIAYNEGVEFVAIHGRTRTQQYTGKANWNLIEEIAEKSPLPIVGNGDLTSSNLIQDRLNKTNCKALMIGRGALRHPFIFLESCNNEIRYNPQDYLEIIKYYDYLITTYTDNNRHRLIQMKKMTVWFLAGFNGVSKFRGEIFASTEILQLLDNIEKYFYKLEQSGKAFKDIDENIPFMTGGHG